jgi:hypothetical protein
VSQVKRRRPKAAVTGTPQERELERRRAYWSTFLDDKDQLHPNAERFMASFRRFCRVDRGGLVISPVQRMTDPYASAYQNGLRDAYLHIETMLSLKFEEENDNARGDTSTDG